MSIFQPCELGVLRVNTCATGGTVVINIDGFRDSSSVMLPITGFTLDLGTNHQFLHTLDEFIYLYAFGDRIGELVLSGVSFAGTCVSDSVTANAENLSVKLAPEKILEYYNSNKVSKATGPEPTFITIGGDKHVLIGFLTGMRLDMPNPTMPVVQWALRYNVVLNKTNIPPTSARTGGTAGGGGPGGSGGGAAPVVPVSSPASPGSGTRFGARPRAPFYEPVGDRVAPGGDGGGSRTVTVTW